MQKHKNDALINALMKKYELEDGVDIFAKERGGKLIYRIINRMGVDKIASKEASTLRINWDLLPISDKDNVYLSFDGEDRKSVV